jgi:hypothetical protein
MLVLLMEDICDDATEMSPGGMTYILSSNITVITARI